MLHNLGWQSLDGRAYWDLVEKIISPMNESGENWTGMKKFWQFIKSMRKDYMGVPALKDKGMTVIDARAKADLLNKQFEYQYSPKKKTLMRQCYSPMVPPTKK